jgi:predicted lipoprotein with Yx(FWY)xxD motif
LTPERLAKTTGANHNGDRAVPIPMRRAVTLTPAALALAFTVASGSAAAGHSAHTTASKHAVVKTRHGKPGTFLVDGRGRTLYLFRKDQGPRSRCAGACAQDWPPVTTSERPEAEGGAKQSMLSTRRRRGGAKQVVYNGHPLYRYAGDTAAGQTNGQGLNAFGARWYVVSTSGRAIRATGASAPAAPSPYGY